MVAWGYKTDENDNAQHLADVFKKALSNMFIRERQQTPICDREKIIGAVKILVNCLDDRVIYNALIDIQRFIVNCKMLIQDPDFNNSKLKKQALYSDYEFLKSKIKNYNAIHAEAMRLKIPRHLALRDIKYGEPNPVSNIGHEVKQFKLPKVGRIQQRSIGV